MFHGTQISVRAGEVVELSQAKCGFLAELGKGGGALEIFQAVRLKGTPPFKIHRRYILRFDITEQPKLYLFHTLACGRIGLICPDSSPCWDNTCQSAPAMFVFSKIIMQNDCMGSWQVGQTVFSARPFDSVPLNSDVLLTPKAPKLPVTRCSLLPLRLCTAASICRSTLVSVLPLIPCTLCLSCGHDQ